MTSTITNAAAHYIAAKITIAAATGAKGAERIAHYTNTDIDTLHAAAAKVALMAAGSACKYSAMYAGGVKADTLAAAAVDAAAADKTMSAALSGRKGEYIDSIRRQAYKCAHAHDYAADDAAIVARRQTAAVAAAQSGDRNDAAVRIAAAVTFRPSNSKTAAAVKRLIVVAARHADSAAADAARIRKHINDLRRRIVYQSNDFDDIVSACLVAVYEYIQTGEHRSAAGEIVPLYRAAYLAGRRAIAAAAADKGRTTYAADSHNADGDRTDLIAVVADSQNADRERCVNAAADVLADLHAAAAAIPDNGESVRIWDTLITCGYNAAAAARQLGKSEDIVRKTAARVKRAYAITAAAR